MEIKFDILEYIGKLDEIIYVLLSLNYEDEFYEGVFLYKKELVILTVEENLEKKLECEIEDWDGYDNLMISILEKAAPYDELIKSIHDFDSNIYEIIDNTSNNS
jgi:hypothetical protein